MKQNKRLARGESFSFVLETKKNLGQNFLSDQTILAEIVGRAAAHFESSGRTCIEIGPGSGALTRRLLEAGWTVYAIEKDTRAVEGLRQSLGQEFAGRLQVIEADILRFEPRTMIAGLPPAPLCIGNIPYYITSEIILWFLNRRLNFSAAILMVQKEVAERICARAGQKNYGRLTVRTQLQCTAELFLEAPAKAFVPPPKVDSAVIELVPLVISNLTDDEEDAFGRFTAMLFSARRKMLRKTLLQAAHGMRRTGIPDGFAESFEANAEKRLGVSLSQRPEELSPEVMLGLFRLLME